MGRINIKLPEDLHEEVKVQAARNGRDLKDEVIKILGENTGVEVPVE